MKLQPKKLKYSLCVYFLLFAAIIIGSLWLFQMLFLEGYYQSLKLKEIKNQGEILKTIDVEKDGERFRSEVKACNDISIEVFVCVVGDNKILSYNTLTPNVTEFSESIVNSAIKEVIKNSGEDYCELKSAKTPQESYFVYAAKSDVSENIFIVMTSSHGMIGEISKVIHWQFLVISAFIAVVAFFLAWYLSGKLSNPIFEMSVTAKKWANGDDNVSFKPKSKYSEITELADALNYAKSEISKSGALQRDLLANVSHDLKTPLTMIKAYAEMINDISGDVKEKREKHTKVIIDEADRLTQLVNDILNLSKLQSSVDSLNETKVNLSELTERVIDRFSEFAEKSGYTIENHVAPDLLTVVDEKKIEQVVYNLLGNSINYTGEDKTVKVYLTAENDKILLEIIDSGKGISQEAIDTIWERYYRFSETNTRPVKGTGLGLSIVKAILDSHGLQFGVRSKKDCGSNFYVEFERLRNE